MIRVTTFAVVLAAGIVGHPEAQDRSVEVASVKRHSPDDRTQWMINPAPGGRLRMVSITPERLVSIAFRSQMDQVVNAPAWAKSDTYDILLKVRDGASVNIDTVGVLAREVLTDRFQLKTRMDTRDLPVYLLVRSRSDGTLGPRLKPAEIDCTLRGGPPPPRGAGESLPAAASRCGLTQRGGNISTGGFPIDAFLRVLAPFVGRVIVNRSDLDGNWDLELDYAPDQPSQPGAPAPPASDAPPLFTAMQEQLGLKLESGRAPVPVVVIESLSRPSED